MRNDDSPVLLHALERLLTDRDGGRLLDLDAYQGLFPGLEEELAEQYGLLVAEAGGADEVDGLRQVGRYRLLEELGRGGQGVVYHAVDDELSRPVALKLLTGLNALGEGASRRFHREAQAASRLAHPGICPIYEYGQDEGVPFIAMGFVHGRSLADFIADRAEGSPPSSREDVDELLLAFEQLARALHAAHEASVVHRDVKPANLMLVPGGHPVVLDFGVARIMETDDGLTQTGHILGTPAYMSPEQVAGREIPLDHRTDVYSLAVSLFEALTLQRPFTAPTREGLYQQILSEPAPDPKRLNPTLPKDVRSILETALQKDPDERYSSAAELADDLGRARRGEAILARPPSLLRRVGKWGARHPAWVAALAVMVVLLAAGGAVVSFMAVRAETALTSWDRLADVRRLEELFAEAQGPLWPPLPASIAAHELWLERIDDLLSRRDQNKQAIEELRERALPQTDADRAADRVSYALEYSSLDIEDHFRPTRLDQPEALASSDDYVRQIRERVATRRSYSFADPADRLRHDALYQLNRNLANLHVGPGQVPVTLADINERLELARGLGMRLTGEDAAVWQRCLDEVADLDSLYDGLALEPTLGLVPLGRDQDSGLWEFWHVASGSRPEWQGEAGGLGAVQLHPTSGDEGLVLVLIPGGEFDMGAREPELMESFPSGKVAPNVDPQAEDGEWPVHPVSLDAFLISKYEVTQGQWQRLWRSNPAEDVRESMEAGRMTPRQPVPRIDWNAARETSRRWNLLLPTEAQWEYACRAGTTTPFHTGTDPSTLTGFANTSAQGVLSQNGLVTASSAQDEYEASAPVGSLRPNAWGLHDMHGNLAEWCRDGFLLYAEWDPRAGDGLMGPLEAWNQRVRRPGSFLAGARFSRSSARERVYPAFAGIDSGFRPSCPAPIRP